jgi:predicted anti-sigma-YlaC factor YlaD
MKSHESIRQMLSLAAAGALGPQDQRQVEEHARVCETCRPELDSWSVYSAGLRRLPQPAVPSDLVERTQARILRERLDATEARWKGLTFGSLGVFSWIVTLGFWALARLLSGGKFEVWGTNLVNAVPWFFVSFVIASITAAATALLIGNRRETGRVL